MKTAIVIPNWNGSEKLLRHLPVVIDVARYEGVKDIVVVDDGSTDDSLQVLYSQFPGVKVLVKPFNSGFSSTVNLGVSKVNTDLVFLLNNDARPEKGFLNATLKHFNNDKVFSVGCNVGGLWSIGKFENGFFWHNQARNSNDASKTHQTLWVSGGSGVFRKAIWDELGGLDELFDPFYEEDVDLGYRATKRGYINLWEPESRVEHYKEKGVIELHIPKSRVRETAQRNQLLFIWKNITDKEMMNDHKKALIKMMVSHPKYALIIAKALIKLPKLNKKRQEEQKYAHLTDEQVFALFAKDF